MPQVIFSTTDDGTNVKPDEEQPNAEVATVVNVVINVRIGRDVRNAEAPKNGTTELQRRDFKFSDDSESFGRRNRAQDPVENSVGFIRLYFHLHFLVTFSLAFYGYIYTCVLWLHLHLRLKRVCFWTNFSSQLRANIQRKLFG